MEVTLEQMLSAREERAFRQFQLNRDWKTTLISFSMNIPGPVKDSPLIRRGFLAGCAALDHRLPGKAVKYRRIYEAVTGWEAVYAVDLDPVAVKSITSAIEDIHPLGRLFDMDVLDAALHKLDREQVGGGSRDCIVCGAPGRGCASRRVHSVPELQAAVHAILSDYFLREDRERIGSAAVRALLDEVCTTPKPGLVDRRNSGSHRDMDIFTFTASAAALAPYFRRCVKIGRQTAALAPRSTFQDLRKAGLDAEQAMYAATGGVNTHKGAIFTMGLLCGAAGRLWKEDGRYEVAALLREVADMTAEAMAQDFRKGSDTAGGRLYAAEGIRGIRGEVSDGLPSVAKIGLPVYEAARSRGFNQNDAGVLTLLHLIANVEDTCLLHRGGLEGAAEAAAKTAGLLTQEVTTPLVEELDDWFIQRDLSPGGCADLLSAVYFLHALCNP